MRELGEQMVEFNRQFELNRADDDNDGEEEREEWECQDGYRYEAGDELIAEVVALGSSSPTAPAS
jgi:hypothetical protein